MKKALAILLLICFSLSFAACTASQANETKRSIAPEEEVLNGKKAIIFVHGIMGGQLYNEETGENIWDFFSGEIENCQDSDNLMAAIRYEIDNEPARFVKIIGNIMAGNDDSILMQMLSDEDGEPLYPTTVAYPDSDTRRRFGGFSAYKGTVLKLEERYGDDYEVKFFNYNWLVDVSEAAEKLEEFILENDYANVVLISHSMGGLVTSKYLTKAENRRRIAKNIVICSPLYGSLYAVQALESKNYFTGYFDLIKGLVALLPLGYIGEAISVIVDRLKESELNQLISNSTTVFQLLPTPELVELYPDVVTIDGENVKESELYDFYENCDWAKKENGELRGTFNKVYSLRESLYVDVNGEKVFASDLVDSFYIGGINHSTAYSARYEDRFSLKNTYDGDGTVLFKSATLGREADGEHVFAVNCEHSDATDIDGELKDVVFSIIDK